MGYVKAKKYLGQHFLKDKNIAKKIVESLLNNDVDRVLEIGPGMGVLTQFLLKNDNYETYVVEIDIESVEYLKKEFPELKDRIISEDFLKFNFKEFSTAKFSIIGNFPYNISSQIFFRVIENKDSVVEVVGMLQKEVAQRLAAKPGSKTYGILSVLLQAYYNIEYLFTVNAEVFSPPPKVKSAVIRLTRNTVKKIDCNEDLFFRVIKTSFNQRRKTLNNSLKPILLNIKIKDEIMLKRPEQLSVDNFIKLTNLVENCMKS
ncbi:MAG: 16S rRNA (adenine(1518)-N(6)/adenine(1519)-N(6))-dimethyltransferase RsmA [Bacteroidetes bacterium]|nr:16S rRNA (adenine(1518)-N(6)/adenine(1519)-N(6))-dimethyltransferase RsmA [Bacteroidota bacterium]